jgi:hypothetical protein
MPKYPILTLTTQGQDINYGAVDVGTLTAQLMPILDALLELFQDVPAKRRGELHRLELGLAVTQQGTIAFATGDVRPSLTLTLERRQRASGTRSATSRSGAAKKPDIVEVD